jgi:transposase-like protein
MSATASAEIVAALLRLRTASANSRRLAWACAHSKRSRDRRTTDGEFDTRGGTLDIAIPKLRSGPYFPDWLLERRRRAERALTTVVATCYLLGVSTRRMEKLVESLGITRLSKSQVSTKS